jgi:hypothetical protein
MAIQMKLGALVDAVPALSRLVQLQMPAKGAYGVARLVKKAQAEIDVFNSVRGKYIEQFGVERETTPEERAQSGQLKTKAVAPEHMPEFLQKMAELSAQDITLDVAPLSLASFGDAAVRPGDLMALGALLTE